MTVLPQGRQNSAYRSGCHLVASFERLPKLALWIVTPVGRTSRIPTVNTESAGGEHAPQQVASPAAHLSHLRRALATLRTLAGALRALVDVKQNDDGPELDAGIARSWLGWSRPPHRQAPTTSPRNGLCLSWSCARHNPREKFSLC